MRNASSSADGAAGLFALVDLQGVARRESATITSTSASNTREPPNATVAGNRLRPGKFR
jgi:hypothetical protein